MLLQASRTHARTGADGELVLLEDQDRSLWDRDLIARGAALLDRALALRQPGPYQLQAAIAALHAQAATPEDTDWRQIALLYGELARLQPSPVVELNRAVAVAMAEGPDAGLALLDGLPLDRYHLFHSARADLLRRSGRPDEARVAYERARELATNPAERAFLERRLAALVARPTLLRTLLWEWPWNPPISRHSVGTDRPRFANRAELECAKLLDYYGVPVGLRADDVRARDGRRRTRHRGVQAGLLPARAGSLPRDHRHEADARDAQEPQAPEAARALSRGEREALLPPRRRAARGTPATGSRVVSARARHT